MQEKYFIQGHEKKLVVPYIQKWGRAPSIAVLDEACKIFYTPGIDGIIGYREEAGCALVFGDPFCDPHDMPLLVEAFHHYFTAQKKTIIYLLASEEFKNWALQHNYIQSTMIMGDENIVDPTIDIKTLQGRRASVVRNQYNQASRTGMIIQEYTGYNPALEKEMHDIGLIWLAQRSGPQTSLLSVNIFSDKANKRWFYVHHNNKIIGVLVLNRLDAYSGWAINMLLVAPHVPKYTSEFILVSVLDILKYEQCHFLSLGTLPCETLNNRMQGFGRVTTFLACTIFQLTKKILKLNSRQQYWQKFNPQKKPSYLLLNKHGIGIREAIGILRAFNIKM